MEGSRQLEARAAMREHRPGSFVEEFSVSLETNQRETPLDKRTIVKGVKLWSSPRLNLVGRRKKGRLRRDSWGQTRNGVDLQNASKN